MKITITSDFLCPWCYIAEARLLAVIEQLKPAIGIELDWRPFELNPNMPEQGMNRKEYRSRKFGWERSQMMDAQIAALGTEDGLAFDYSAIQRAPNTRLAHRLLEFCRPSGLATPYALQVFRAYFEQGRDIGNQSVLLDIVQDLGLARAQAQAFLAGEGGLRQVISAEQEAMMQGIHSVPHIQIGDVAISGAQPVAVFRDAIVQAAAKAQHAGAVGCR